MYITYLYFRFTQEFIKTQMTEYIRHAEDNSVLDSDEAIECFYTAYNKETNGKYTYRSRNPGNTSTT